MFIHCKPSLIFIHCFIFGGGQGVALCLKAEQLLFLCMCQSYLTCLSMGIWVTVTSAWWPLWIMLQWTWESKCLLDSFTVLLETYLEEGLLGYMVGSAIVSFFKEPSNCLVTAFTVLPVVQNSSSFSTSALTYVLLQWMWGVHIFHLPFASPAPFFFLLWRKVCWSSLPSSYLGFVVELYEFFI